MNPRKYMIIINGEIKTSEIKSCRYNPATQKMDVEFNDGRKQTYAYSDVERIIKSRALNPAMYRVSKDGREFLDIKSIYVFKGKHEIYWRICFKDSSEREYLRSELQIDEIRIDREQSASRCKEIHRIVGSTVKGNNKAGGNKLAMHKDKCRKMFDKIKNGERLYIRIERVASEDDAEKTYIEEMSPEDTQYTRISLLTDDMLAYDSEMFRIEDGTVLRDNYRPYFASFNVPLNDNRNDIEAIGDGWRIGRLISPGESDTNEAVLLNGFLETSASPVNYLDDKKLLVFTDRTIDKSVLDRINSTYDPNNFMISDNKDIEQILNDAWEQDFPNTIDIYNVGHGNADYIKGANHRILYDIGYNYRSFPSYHQSKYLKAVNAIRHLKPSCVILSHWDMDHIIGCAYAQKDIFNSKWIAPFLVSSKDKKATPNSIRLAHYLKVLGNLCLVDRDQKNKLIATIACAYGIEMKLWLGGGSSRLTPKNREGLMIEIIDGTKTYSHVLLAGDVPYKCMPDILSNPIDFIHVPHHCSNMELDRLRSIPGKGICAIISTNRKKCGGFNYDANHHGELEKKFTEVINTSDNDAGDDEANLSIQINYIYSHYDAI